MPGRSPIPAESQQVEQRAITPVLGRSSRAFRPVHNRRALTVTDAPFPLGLASLGNQHFQHGPDPHPRVACRQNTQLALNRLSAFRLSDLSPPLLSKSST